jgi:hypothetical protein
MSKLDLYQTAGVDQYRAGTMGEEHLLSTFRELAAATAGCFWHVRQAKGQALTGLTDVLIAVPPVFGAFELKTQRDRISAEQLRVAEVLARCDRFVSGVVRPVPKPDELSLDEAICLLTDGW